MEEPTPRVSVPIPVDEDATEVLAAPALAAARAASAATEMPRQDPRADAAKLRAAVDEALAPLQRSLVDVLRRLEELERRPQPMAAAAPISIAAAPRAQALSYHALESTGVVAMRAPALSMHSLDVAAIERDTSIVVDDALNGRSRRLRLVLILALFLVAVFGCLGFMLVKSYSPHS